MAKERIISVTSGKGGVGKTMTSISLAIASQNKGQRTLIVDGDMGLANIDIVMGLNVRATLQNVLDGHADIADIVIEGPNGMHILPSGSGIVSLANMGVIQRAMLLDQLSALSSNYDVVIIDTGAGISDNVLSLNSVANDVVVVTTPEPHAIADAYAVIKVLSQDHGVAGARVLVNQVHSNIEGLRTYERIKEVATKFLDVSLDYMGSIPHDQQVLRHVLARKMASQNMLQTVAAQAWQKAMFDLLETAPMRVMTSGLNRLWSDGFAPPEASGPSF